MMKAHERRAMWLGLLSLAMFAYSLHYILTEPQPAQPSAPSYLPSVTR